jgi:hypothetical protein
VSYLRGLNGVKMEIGERRPEIPRHAFQLGYSPHLLGVAYYQGTILPCWSRKSPVLNPLSGPATATRTMPAAPMEGS